MNMAVKILFFIENLTGGGAEKVLCNLVNTMDQSKFEITVQTLWKADADRFLKPGVHYRYCYPSKSVWNQYRSRFEAATGWIYPLHIKGNYDIEVAYLEFGSTKILSHSTNKRAKKISWVHSDLNRKLDGNSKTLQKIKKQYAAYDKIICVSQTARESFNRLLGREEDAIILYNTIDDTAIREKAALSSVEVPEKKLPTIVAVGRLSEEKQYDMLLRVHKALLEKGLMHELWIIGEGGERDKLETIISENRLEESARLLGYKANPYPFMKAADLLVCSSRYEGFSTFVAEGLILGKPIVTTECSGMRELLGDSEYGLIVDNKENALLEGIAHLLMNRSLREDYSCKALHRALMLSAFQTTQKTEEFFFHLVKDELGND